MEAAFTEFWESPEHTEFVNNLNVDRLHALRDLMIIATFADRLFTVEERVELGTALGELPGLDDTLNFETAAAVDHVDDLMSEYDEQGDHLLETLLARIGDTLDLSHALEAVVVLMATNDKGKREATFARRLGVLMDVPDDFVEHLLQRYGWAV